MAKDEECFASADVLHVGQVRYILYMIYYTIYMAKDEECFASEEVLHVGQVRDIFYSI